MRYKHIVFDVDGTLIDTEYAVLTSLQETIFQLQKRKLHIDELDFTLGIPGEVTLEKLGVKDTQAGNFLWNENLKKYYSSVTIFDGIKSTIKELKRRAYKIGIITSKNKEEYKNDFLPFEISEYFDYVICADDSIYHKPNPAPMNAYLELTGAKKEDVLYIGDSIYDMQCALEAGVHCALALWGCHSVQHIKATYYLNQPYEIINLFDKNIDALKDKSWLRWAMELQFIAQAGITYSKDAFDIERFERIREVSVEILSTKTELPLEHVKNIFCNETGFQTPKLDTRAVIFQNNRILLVKEKNGTWSLPGGWVDVNQSIKSNTIKEVKEEAGLDVIPVKLIALQDRNLHNAPVYAYGVCKAFVLCEIIGGEFEKNIETIESRYFSLEELPNLAQEKNNEAQIRMCFEAYRDEKWQVLFD